MRLLLLLLACWFTFPTAGLSQKVRIELHTGRDHFLVGESVQVFIRISNFAGRPLILGLDNEWLSFSVNGPDRKPLDRLTDLAIKGPFSIANGATATRSFELSSAFDFSQSGPYQLTATIQLKDWNEAFRTLTPKKIELLRGVKIVDQEIGVPSPPGSPPSAIPETRRYGLLGVRQGQLLTLYFRLTDASATKTLRVFPLGSLVNFGKPETQIDRHSFLHVLYHTSARGFAYCAINTSGDIIIRQQHEFVSNRPTLVLDRVGDVLITGGLRRFRPDDIPPSNMLTKPENEPAPPPPPTEKPAAP